MSIPANVTVASRPLVRLVSANSALIDGNAKPINRISAASAAQVTPHTYSSLRWNGP